MWRWRWDFSGGGLTFADGPAPLPRCMMPPSALRSLVRSERATQNLPIVKGEREDETRNETAF